MKTHIAAHGILLLACIAFSTEVHAYIGPGVGLSAIGTVIAFIAGILMLIIGFVWYPFKRLYRRLSAQPATQQKTDTGAEEGSSKRRPESDKHVNT